MFLLVWAGAFYRSASGPRETAFALPARLPSPSRAFVRRPRSCCQTAEFCFKFALCLHAISSSEVSTSSHPAEPEPPRSEYATGASPMCAAGVVGFKCFLIPSGVEEFSEVTEDALRSAMRELARMGATLIAHAELPGPVERALAGCCAGGADGDPRRYETFLRSRPREA